MNSDAYLEQVQSQNKAQVQHFFDKTTYTLTYVVSDPTTQSCAVIDPVLNFDHASGCTSTDAADEVIAYIKEHELKLQWIIESHVHADHLSSASYLKQQLGGKIAISKEVTQVQTVFAKVFNEDTDFPCDGSQFDVLFEPDESYKVGNLQAIALSTPGHTPACMTHIIGDSVFLGDTIFMPDSGTSRCDFPGGDAHQLYQSLQRILALPDETRLFVCHDYQPGGRDLRWETSLNEQKQDNIHLKNDISEDDYVKMRLERDAYLKMPKLLLPSLQVNMRAGEFPAADSNGITYLKLPINAL